MEWCPLWYCSIFRGSKYFVDPILLNTQALIIWFIVILLCYSFLHFNSVWQKFVKILVFLLHQARNYLACWEMCEQIYVLSFFLCCMGRCVFTSISVRVLIHSSICNMTRILLTVIYIVEGYLRKYVRFGIR